VAARAGAVVLQEEALLPAHGPTLGKGDAMWRALSALGGDLVCFLDADTEGFSAHFATGLLGPLMCEADVSFVKGFYRRPFSQGDVSLSEGGGRVNHLMARPALALFYPQLADVRQPLAGEVAARRSLLQALPFVTGYGVEIAMLIDAWRLVGLDRLAQVDLGARQNRHQSLRDLSAMAYAVLVAAESRFLGRDFADTHAVGSISLPALGDDTPIESRPVTIEERPPVRELRELAPAESASSA
jgi:glucosyl-3-phosphoglycerate synthase